MQGTGARRAWFWAAAGMLVAIGSVAKGQVGAELPQGALRLSNGDVYEGQWLPGEGGLIRWQSGWFAAPFQFECRYLEELAMRSVPQEYQEEPFRLLVSNGDVLHGDLVALDGTTVTLRSERHGMVRVNRSSLLKLTRLNNPSLVFSGPSSLEGWMVLDGEGRRRRESVQGVMQFWTPVSGGGLKTERWRAELYRPLELPEQLEVDFQITCSARPEFTLALHEDLENSVRLETWDDALVLTKGTGFQLVRLLGQGERELRIRIFWDRKSGQFSLYDDEADVLVKAPFAAPADKGAGRAGFFIRNKSIDMSLDYLRIAKWNGSPPRKMQEQGIRIRKSDGAVLRDGIVGLERPGSSLVLQAGERLPVSEIDTIYFREDERLVEKKSAVEFSYPDGTRVSGTLLGVNPSEALVRTDYAAEAVAVRLPGLKQIRFPGGESPVPLESGDELSIEGETFRGTLAGGGQGEGEEGGPIRWRALGSANAVPIRPGLSAQIVRRGSPQVGSPDGDRLFLKTGEILSCRVEAVDGKVVRLRTGLSSLRELPVEMVKAMEFREGRLQLAGFGDRDWQERSAGPGSLLREADTLTLNGGGLFHPSILRGDEVHFGLNWKEKGQSAMTLGLFGSQLPGEHLPLEISFTCWGNRLWVSAVESSTGQTLDTDDVMVEGGSTAVEVKMAGDRIAVLLNGVEMMQFEFALDKRTGNALLLETGGAWASEGKLNPLALDQFEVRSSTGLLNPLRVDEGLRGRALLVPRFRRDNPDDTILIGGNGDLIRGRLSRVDAAGVALVTRLRDVTFARDRLSGLVRLEDGVFEVPAATPGGKEVSVFLTDGSVVRVQPVRMTQSVLEGTSPALGTCQLPVAHIRQMRLGSFEPVPGSMLYADWVRKPAPEPVLPEDKESGGVAMALVNQEAPDFSLRTVKGQPFQLAAQRGRIIVLNFWASWSGQSRQCLEELLKAVGPARERVRLVTVNQAEPESLIQKYLEKNKWSFDVAMDPAEKVGQGFGLESIPHTVVIDAEGKIRWAESGFRLGMGSEVAELLKSLEEKAKDLPLPPAPAQEEPQISPLES